MILLPTEPLGWRVEDPLVPYPPLKTWLACRPVAEWQYDGYRILTGQKHGADAEPAWSAGVTRAEAQGYARFVGKTLSGHGDWEAAAQFVSPPTLDDMWGDQPGEWSRERSNYDEDLAFVTRRDSFEVDLDDALDAHDLDGASDPRGWAVFPLSERLPGIGFRTTVSIQIGLMSRGDPV
jgi:hypothetical protein